MVKIAFGKKNHVNLDILAYNHCLLGVSGVGKTSTVYRILQKLVGDDGYLFLEIGNEKGADAIEGINYINCPKWDMDYDEVNNSAGFADVCDDIIENKETEYPNLKCIVVDTYDQLINIAEEKSIALYNRQSDTKAKTINAAWGGFGRGEKKAIDLMFDKLAELDQVGVKHFVIGHIKTKDITDPVSNETYQILTSDQQQNYFNALKKQLDVLSLAYIDRDIVKENKKFAGQSKEVGHVKAESRKVKFRDDGYCVDSKSRFEQIVDEINLDADEYIKAVEDAIMAERNKSGEELKVSQKRQEELEQAQKVKASEASKKLKENKVDEDKNEELIKSIKAILTESDKSKMISALEIIKKEGYSSFNADVPTKILEEVLEVIS